MALCSPNNSVGVMVNNDSDVFVALFVAGFINADIYQAIKASSAVWLDIISSSVNTVANCFPVDAHVLRNNAARKIHGKPGCCQIKTACKSTVRICPWYICYQHTMIRTIDSASVVFNLHQCGTPSQVHAKYVAFWMADHILGKLCDRWDRCSGDLFLVWLWYADAVPRWHHDRNHGLW